MRAYAVAVSKAVSSAVSSTVSSAVSSVVSSAVLSAVSRAVYCSISRAVSRVSFRFAVSRAVSGVPFRLLLIRSLLQVSRTSGRQFAETRRRNTHRVLSLSCRARTSWCVTAYGRSTRASTDHDTEVVLCL